MHEPCLQWVKVSDEIHHVSDFARLSPIQRPKALCPVCNQPVLLKLGSVRIHHVAHYKGAICATSQPETLIHLNAKYHIKRELDKSKQLKIWQNCNGWKLNGYIYECSAQDRRAIVYIDGWDTVEVELGYSKYRLDIALIKNREIIGAVEVFVTHQSEENKLIDLTKNNIAWIEIKVGQDFYTSPTEWKAEIPLEIFNNNPQLLDQWQCPYCITHEKETNLLEKQSNDQKQNRQPKEQQQNIEFAKKFETKFLRLIDFYYPSKKKYRQIYEIQTRSEKGNIVYTCLNELDYKDDRITRRQIKIENSPSFDNNFESLKVFLNTTLNNKNKSWTIDKSRSWFSPKKRFHPNQFMDLVRYPYNFELENNQWKKIERKSHTSNHFNPHYFIPKKYETNEEEPSPKPPDPENKLAFLAAEYPCEKCGQVTSDWVQLFGKTKTCICRECANKSE